MPIKYTKTSVKQRGGNDYKKNTSIELQNGGQTNVNRK